MSEKKDIIIIKGAVISEIVGNWMDECHDREENDLEDLVQDRMDYINRISKCLSLKTIKEIWFDCLWSDRTMFEETWKELKEKYVIKTKDD